MYLKTELYELVKTDERIFDFIQEGSLDGLWYWDLENPENEWMNAKFWTVLGYNPEEMPHKSSAWQEIINQEDLKLATENFLKHCEDPNHPYDQIVRYTHKNGSTIWIRCRGIAIHEANGKPIRMLGAHQDITELKSNELALAETKKIAEEREKRFKSVIENATDGVAIVDAQGIFQYVSPNAIRLFGYDLEDFYGLSGDEYTHPDDLPIVLKAIESIFIDPTKKPKLQYRFKRKDGEYRWIETIFTNLLADPSINGIVLNFTDITERRQMIDDLLNAKENAEENEKRFRNAIENSPIPTAIVGRDRETIYLNKQFVENYGYEVKDIPNIETWYEKAYPDPIYRKKSVEDWQNEVEQSIKNGTPTKIKEYLVTCKNGDIKTVAVSAYFEKEIIVGLFQDITERKQAEEALRKSEERFALAIDASNQGIWDWNVISNEVFYSEQWKRQIGYEDHEIVNEFDTWIEHLHPDERQSHINTVQEYLSNPTGHFYLEFRFRHKDGSYRWIYNKAASILNDKGQVVRMFGTHTDITEQKHTQEAIISLKEFNESIVTNLGEGIILEDKNGIIQFANPAMLRMLGYSEDELVGENWRCFVPDDQVELVKRANKRRENGESDQYEMELLRKTGERIFVLVGGVPNVFGGNYIGLLAAFTDITDQKLAEQLLKEKNEEIAAQNEEMAVQNEELIQVNIELLDAKQEVEESEEKLKSIFRVAPAGIGVLHNRIIADVNPKICEMTGYAINELVGKSARILYPTSKEFEFVGKEKYEQISMYGTGSVETRWQRKDGKIIDILLNSTPIINDDLSKGVIFTALDISERKMAELELLKAKQEAEESEERFHLAMKASTDGLFDWNLITNEIYYSPAWKKMIGYEEHELPNDFSVWEKTTDPEDVKKSWELQQKLISKQIDRFVIEFKMKHKKGHWIDVLSQAEAVFNDSGNAVRIVGTHTDITKRKQAEEALRNSEQRFRSLVDTINSGVAFYKVINDGMSGSDYIIQSFNDFALKHENHTLEDVVGKSLKDIRPEIDDYGLIDTFREVWKTGKPALFPAKLYIDKKYYNYYENRVFKISNEEIVAVYDDVTQREEARLALQDALKKAQESDRLKSAFLANMSHEIRTPMNGILGFSDLLKNPDLTGEQQNDYIGIIQKSGARMLNIINDIIDISKIEAGQMELNIKPTNINEQVEYAYRFFKPEADAKGLKLYFSQTLSDQKAMVNTDSEKVYAILTNLVKNALKYTNEGFIEIGYEHSSSFLTFYVKDTGIGIPDERQAAIFERFIQADIDDKMARQGAGLGLAISKAYVEMLGGKIWVKSSSDSKSANKGSSFYFTIPFNSNQELESSENQVGLNTKKQMYKKLNILIAEDDEVSKMLIEHYINEYMKELFVAKTGFEAVNLCRNNPNIDLILMDIRMPEMGGYEAVKRIREFNKNVIIIAQTAYGLLGDRENAIAAGCNEYISKPIVKLELQKLIQKFF